MTDPETPTVERFTLEDTYDYSQMTPEPEGGWVRYADYLTLHAEHQRLREERRDFQHRANVAEPAVTALRAYVDRLESDLARLRAEKEQIQAMNKGPVEQIQHIPLPRFVKTRFVHVGDCNEMIDKVTHKLTALQDAVKEDIDARYAQAALACSGSANKYEWLKASQRVDAASKALRALVDPPQQKET